MKEALFPNEPRLTTYKSEWEAVGQISVDCVLTPFTTKALYIFGMMRHLMESAGWALKHKPPGQAFYIAAYLMSCGAIELFGRCISGDDDEKYGATRRLKCGLKEIASIPQSSDDDTRVVVVTNHKQYTIDDCVALRNFCAHGGSVGKVSIDVEFVDEVLKKVSWAMDGYWNCLMSTSNDDAKDNLAKAAVAPLFAGRGPDAIFVDDLYNHIKNGLAVNEGLMYRDAWQTYK